MESERRGRVQSIPLLLRVAAALAATLLLGARPSAEAVLRDAPPGLAERLRAERVVVVEEGGGAGPESFIVALVLFDQPPARVAALLREAERQTEYRPELVGVRTVEEVAGGRIDEQRIRILFRELVYRLRYEDDGDGRVTWSLAEGFENDLARMRGFWELHGFEQDPARTLGRFGSDVDVGRGVPEFVQKGMGRRTVVRYVENFRRWVDSGGAWRP